MSTLVYLNEEQIRRVAAEIRKIELRPDPFTDPRYYPPPDDDPERVAAYFFTMVAIDHRTHYPRPYVLKIDQEEYRGADLLWRLGRELYERDPDFFTAWRLAQISEDTVRRWLCPDGVSLWDTNIRTFLIRDLGTKVLKLYSGKFLNIVEQSKGLLYNDGEGFVERMKIFRAYEDPVEKKIFLLVKFLYRRGLLRIRDVKNLHVPVDNHLVKIAYRLGIVVPSRELLSFIKEEIELPVHLDTEIRFKVREAWKKVSQYAGIDPTVLDDFLWNHGRRVCTRENPHCSECSLRHVCRAYKTGDYTPEHVHILTWYY